MTVSSLYGSAIFDYPRRDNRQRWNDENLSIYTPPYGEPISLNEIKTHCKVDTDMTDDDALLSGLITSGRRAVETASLANTMRNAVMLATTFEYNMTDYWIDYCAIVLPRVPLISLDSFTYIDNGGVEQTVSSDVYEVDYATGRINLAYGAIWPSARYQQNAVKVRFTAGLAAVFTAVAGTDVCTVQGRTFTTGDRVQVMNSGGTLPGGLLASTVYYVINASGSTFKLSLTSGGTAVDITTTGSGVQFISKDIASFQALRNALMLLAGYWYRNREAAQIALGLTAIELPMAVDALVASVYV